MRWLFHGLSLIILMTALLGCSYQAAVRQLSPAVQAEFHAYRQVMTPLQIRRYVNKTTAAERTAYLEEIGLAMRFQALDPQDRQTVLSRQLRRGASADALRFLWGLPYYTEGRRGHYERWVYVGSSFSLAATGNQARDAGAQVVVHLVDGRVESWLDVIPSTQDDAGDTCCHR